MGKTVRFWEQGIGLVPVSADPSNPRDGQLQVSDGTARASGLWIYQGGTWNTIAGGGGLDTFTTVALAEAAAGYSEPDLIYVVETESFYRYESNSSETDNNTFILSTADGGTTRWIAVGGKYIFGSVNTQTIDTDNLVVGNPSAYDLLQYSGSSFVPQYLAKNYIKNSDALYNTSGWSTYSDAAQSTPENGTGGSPTITLTRNTSSPLRGSADFKLSKPASNEQGEGVSYDFTIDSADQSKPMYISGDYKVSANYSYTNNDLVFYIYDITNAVLIQPVPYILDGSGKFKFEFQSNAGSTSYRLIFHIATTNASAWDFNFVNVIISATPLPSMINILDKEYDISSYVSANNPGTMSVTRAVGIPYKTKTGIWRLKFNVKVTFSSQSISYASIHFSGVTFKTGAQQAITGGFASGTSSIGTNGYVNDGSGDAYIYVSSSYTTVACLFYGDVELDSMPTWAVDYYPVSLSDGAETRDVAAILTGDPASASAGNPIIVPTISYDSHTAYNNSTGRYTCPVTGRYRLFGSLKSASSATSLNIYKNASIDVLVGNLDSNGEATFCGSVRCNAGDIIDIRPAGTVDATDMVLTIERNMGPAINSAGEFVGCKYFGNAGQSITSGTTFINETKSYDTHGAYNSSTGRFTAPVSGYYDILGNLTTSSSSWSAGNNIIIQIYKNGSLHQSFYTIISASLTSRQGMSYSTTIHLDANEYIDIKDASSVSYSLTASTTEANSISITKQNK